MIFEYKDKLYPEYIKNGNAVEHIETTAKHFCKGKGLDIGGFRDWTLKGAIPINIADDILDYNAEYLPKCNDLDYIFSSHCVEHLDNPIDTMLMWKSRLKENGCLFLYMPHPDMLHWHPKNCDKHKNIWTPSEMKDIFKVLGLKNIIHSERDLYWSFSIVGYK